MSDKALLIHTIKAIKYRFVKATSGSNEHFGTFRIGSHVRSPNELLNHMYDLVTKTISRIKEGHFDCPSPEYLDFDGETARLINGLNKLQSVIETVPIEPEVSKKLLQGPILDMATHIGQLAMLNGLNGNKIQKENYYSADVE